MSSITQERHARRPNWHHDVVSNSIRYNVSKCVLRLRDLASLSKIIVDIDRLRHSQSRRTKSQLQVRRPIVSSDVVGRYCAKIGGGRGHHWVGEAGGVVNDCLVEGDERRVRLYDDAVRANREQQVGGDK